MFVRALLSVVSDAPVAFLRGIPETWLFSTGADTTAALSVSFPSQARMGRACPEV